jgi:rubrerythrin
MMNNKKHRYFCEFEDCDFETTTDNPSEKCPTCGRPNWRTFQTLENFDILESIGNS